MSGVLGPFRLGGAFGDASDDDQEVEPPVLDVTAVVIDDILNGLARSLAVELVDAMELTSILVCLR